jgi:hypothetical protein
MELGEALDIYGRVCARLGEIMAGCDGSSMTPLVRPSAVAGSLKIKTDRMRVAVEHVLGKPYNGLVGVFYVNRYCELVMGGMTVRAAIKALGMEKLVYQFYGLFRGRMRIVTGRKMSPGDFAKMVKSSRIDPFAPTLKNQSWLNSKNQ